MDVADMLLEKLFSWVKLQKQCADNLNSLATELEKHKKNVNISNVVGSSASVGGAAAMTAAGVLSIFTGGLAIPVLAIGGAVVSGLALANKVGSEVISAIISGSTMKEAEEITQKITDLGKKIEEDMKKLQAEGQKREKQASSCADVSEDVERYVVERILRAMAKRVGLHLHDGINLHKMLTALSKNTISGTDTAFSLLQRSGPGLTLLSKFVVKAVAKTSGKKVVSKLLPELVTSVGPKAAAKAAGRIAGGAVGLVVSVPELISDCINLDDCETEGSKTLRQNAQVIRTASEDMEKELQEIQKVFQRLARVKRSIENTERSCDERETLITFLIEHCKDKVVQDWLRANSKSRDFSKLVNMFHFLKQKLDEEKKKLHSNTVDITFVAHGAITDPMIPASCLLPLPTITDVILYSPWNCVITAAAAYGVATGLIEPQHRVFFCKNQEECKIPDQKHQPTKLPSEWNSMKKAGDRKIPKIMLSPLELPEDGFWKAFEILENKHGKPGRNRIVIPFILPGKSEGSVPFFVVSLALSVVLFFSTFQATLHLTACLGKYGNIKLDEDALKEQYCCTIDNTAMTSSNSMLPSRLFTSFKEMFDNTP